jgi:hypothetical protein
MPIVSVAYLRIRPTDGFRTDVLPFGVAIEVRVRIGPGVLTMHRSHCGRLWIDLGKSAFSRVSIRLGCTRCAAIVAD